MPHARSTILLLPLTLCLGGLLLSGCQGAVATGPIPTGSISPITAKGSANGDSTGPQVFLLGVPLNALVKIHGDVQYFAQGVAPFVTLDGDFTIIVEPLPGKEAEAQQAVQMGHLLIRRGGQPGALNAPGSIQALKAATASLKTYTFPKPAPMTSSVTERCECPGGFCKIPDPLEEVLCAQSR